MSKLSTIFFDNVNILYCYRYLLRSECNNWMQYCVDNAWYRSQWWHDHTRVKDVAMKVRYFWHKPSQVLWEYRIQSILSLTLLSQILISHKVLWFWDLGTHFNQRRKQNKKALVAVYWKFAENNWEIIWEIFCDVFCFCFSFLVAFWYYYMHYHCYNIIWYCIAVIG